MKGEDIPFGIVERFGPCGEWELFFGALPLVADRAEIDALFRKPAQSLFRVRLSVPALSASP